MLTSREAIRYLQNPMVDPSICVAVASAAKGKPDKAIKIMEKATALEESVSPPPGPPPLIKSSHELFGEILLRASRPKEAAKQFARSLLRQPDGHTRSLARRALPPEAEIVRARRASIRSS
jgi:hypothetical protein